MISNKLIYGVHFMLLVAASIIATIFYENLRDIRIYVYGSILCAPMVLASCYFITIMQISFLINFFIVDVSYHCLSDILVYVAVVFITQLSYIFFDIGIINDTCAYLTILSCILINKSLQSWKCSYEYYERVLLHDDDEFVSVPQSEKTD